MTGCLARLVHGLICVLLSMSPMCRYCTSLRGLWHGTQIVPGMSAAVDGPILDLFPWGALQLSVWFHSLLTLANILMALILAGDLVFAGSFVFCWVVWDAKLFADDFNFFPFSILALLTNARWPCTCLAIDAMYYCMCAVSPLSMIAWGAINFNIKYV